MYLLCGQFKQVTQTNPGKTWRHMEEVPSDGFKELVKENLFPKKLKMFTAALLQILELEYNVLRNFMLISLYLSCSAELS